MKRAFMCAVLLGAAASKVQADEVLTVDRSSGEVGVERLGMQLSLKPGDPLSERDLVQVGDGGSLSVAFAGHGFIEMGPGSEVAIEKLPFAGYAEDLQTIFSLRRGYLRVVWKLPPRTGGWPLFVYFGAQHAALSPGEYFFDNRPGTARACVAAGRLSVLPKSGGELLDLRPSACYRFVGNLPPETVAHDNNSWAAMRRGFDIDAPSSPEAMLAAGDAVGDEADSEPSSNSSAMASPVTVAPKVTLPAPAAAKPAPAVPHSAPASQPSASGEWGVNVVAYPAADNADKHARQLRAAGYAAAVQQVQVEGRPWYRVQLRGYPSADAARAAADELQKRFSYRGLWVSKTGPMPAPGH